ncbi:PEFG-CTERM domain-containing protein [Nitrosopumilus sp.]|uniref:PEFG-CTERM domain-containing protein n=1 Tax=Nitrosopumilus sp. TaxID=2024843 RepID=UPI003B59A1A0
MSVSTNTEYVFGEMEAFGQYPDIGQLMAEKITFEIGDETFDIYYGYKGSLDSIGAHDDDDPVLSSMTINEERKSIEIIMEDVPEKTDFWVRIPHEVLYAEDAQFTVLVDGVDTGYDVTNFPNDFAIGFIITETTENIEIIGTRVIPEFGIFSVMVLGISVLGLICLLQRSSFGQFLAK